MNKKSGATYHKAIHGARVTIEKTSNGTYGASVCTTEWTFGTRFGEKAATAAHAKTCADPMFHETIDYGLNRVDELEAGL